MPRPDRNRNRIILPERDRIKDGRVFEISKRTDRGVLYLRCRTRFCGGTAKKMSPRGDIIEQRGHSALCFKDSNAQLKADFKYALKDALKRNFWKLKEVYETVVAMYPRDIKILVPYNTIVSSLKRWRRHNYPPCPKSLEDMAEQLAQPGHSRLLEYNTGRLVTKNIIDSDGKLHVLIYDPEFLRDEFRNVTRIFIDGTFQTTPRVTGVYQLVSILGVTYAHVLPFAHILMSKKTECAYVAVLSEIKQSINSASIAVVMTDFEQGLRNAARNTFPNAHIAGCSVHYDRALLKKIKSLRLTQLIRDNQEAKFFIKKIMALAYLPETQIQPVYWELKTASTPVLWRSLAGFISYYERQWLRVVKPSGFSVFGLTRRTNNVIESYNSVLAVKLGKHPNAWTFLVKLIQLISNARDDVQSLKLSKRIKRYPRYGTTYKQKEIIMAWRQLHSSEITPTEFLEKAAMLKGHVCQRLPNIPDERLEEDVNAELQATPDNVAGGDPDYDSHIFESLPFNDDALNENADISGEAVNRESDLDNSVSSSSIGSTMQADDDNEVFDARENEEAIILADVPPEQGSTFNGDLEMEFGLADTMSASNPANADNERLVHRDPGSDVDAAETIQVANNELPIAVASNHQTQIKVSASRKKNLRKKRRRQMKSQNSDLNREVRPYGHKRRRTGNDKQAPKP